MKITDYKTIVFDCDGVVLDSNKIKTQAFFNSAISYGEIKAQELVNYHIERGGVSRYKKFEWFIERFGTLPDIVGEFGLQKIAKEILSHCRSRYQPIPHLQRQKSLLTIAHQKL